MAGENRTIIRNAVITGVLTAISAAVIYMVILTNLWWDLQGSFGHAMFHKLEDYVMGAEYMQGIGLLFVLSMAAGALTAYFSRAYAKDERAAVRAGAFTGMVIACTFCICAVIAFLLISAGMPESIEYMASNAPFILFVSLVLPSIVTVPSAAAGAILLLRNVSDANGGRHGRMSQGTAILVAIVGSIILACLIAAVISLRYDIPAIYPLVYSIPMLLTLPLLAAGMNAPYKAGTIPVVLVILALSAIAIVVLPLTGTMLACQTGLISASPYEWEVDHAAYVPPDFRILSELNAKPVMEDLVNSFAQQHGLKVGLSGIRSQGDNANVEVINSVNLSLFTIGVIERELSSEEADPGLNQTIVAYNKTKAPLVFVTRGELSANVTEFLNYTLGSEGRAILVKSGFVPA